MSNWITNIFNKANPFQPDIAISEAGAGYSTVNIKSHDAFNSIGIVNRCVTLISDSATEVPLKLYKVDTENDNIKEITNTRLARFFIKPNDQYDRHRFITNLIVDLVVEGNAFIYIDSDGLYHLPSRYVVVIEDKLNFVRGYKYTANGANKTISADNIIHVRLPNNKSVYRGASRIDSIINELTVYKPRLLYQNDFFNNSALPKMVLESDNSLSKQAKERLLEAWRKAHSTLNRKSSGTAILDGGLKAKILDNSFKDLDFNEGMLRLEKHIALTLGVPWVLLSSGNNANIRNNQRLFYQQTVLPLMSRIATAIEFHIHKLDNRTIGNIRVHVDEFAVSALRPDLKDHASYLATLTNGGIITPNESRLELRKKPIDGLDEIRVPVNVAGSAADPSQGGKPSGN